VSESAIARQVARLVAIYPGAGYDNVSAWPLCTQLTPRLLALRAAAPDEDLQVADWSDLLNRVGNYFHGRALYAQAAPLYQRALTISEKVLGTEHFHTATILNNLGLLLKMQGDFAGARPLFERALEMEKSLGSHPVMAMTLNNFASLLEAQGDLVRARPLLKRAL
jgi:tetratricopeptide (TPR) repeat protein